MKNKYRINGKLFGDDVKAVTEFMVQELQRTGVCHATKLLDSDLVTFLGYIPLKNQDGACYGYEYIYYHDPNGEIAENEIPEWDYPRNDVWNQTRVHVLDNYQEAITTYPKLIPENTNNEEFPDFH